MGLGQVLAVGSFPLEQIRNGIEPESVEAEVQPEAQDVEHGIADVGVVVVEVGLVGEEAMPVVGAGSRVIGPVGDLGVSEDDPGVLVALVGIGPHVPIALGIVRARARLLKPGVIAGGVVHDQVGDHPYPPRMRGLDQLAYVVDGAVVGMDLGEVRDVVAPVAQGRLVERQQPDAVDSEPLQVVELVGQPAEVARAVAVGVEEAADVDLVEDRSLEPQRLGLEPLPRLGLSGLGGLGVVVRAVARALGSARQQMSEGGGSDASLALDLEHVRLPDARGETDEVVPDPPLEVLV